MPTHYFIALLLISVSFGHSLKAQETESKIQNIRSILNRINAEKGLTTKKLENDEYLEHVPDGGGELTGYYKGDTLLKITNWVGISSGVIKDEYYFDRGELVFVYESQTRFVYNDSLQEMNYSKQKVAFEGRYYFYKNTLIKAIKKGISMHSYLNVTDSTIAIEYIKDAAQFAPMLNKKGRHT